MQRTAKIRDQAANKANHVRPVAGRTISTTKGPPEAAPIYRLVMHKSMTRGISRSTGMSSQTAVCSHQMARRIARRARMSSDGAMRAELLPRSERRSSDARIGDRRSCQKHTHQGSKQCDSRHCFLLHVPISRRCAGPPAQFVGTMKTRGMRVCSTRRSAVQRSSSIGRVPLACDPRNPRWPEHPTRCSAVSRAVDLGAVAGYGVIAPRRKRRSSSAAARFKRCRWHCHPKLCADNTYDPRRPGAASSLLYCRQSRTLWSALTRQPAGPVSRSSRDGSKNPASARQSGLRISAAAPPVRAVARVRTPRPNWRPVLRSSSRA